MIKSINLSGAADNYGTVIVDGTTYYNRAYNDVNSNGTKRLYYNFKVEKNFNSNSYVYVQADEANGSNTSISLSLVLTLE